MPEVVSVVGFDDIPEAEIFWPPLTTVRQDFDELARRAVAALVEGEAGGEIEPTGRPMLVPELIGASRPRPAEGCPTARPSRVHLEVACRIRRFRRRAGQEAPSRGVSAEKSGIRQARRARSGPPDQSG